MEFEIILYALLSVFLVSIVSLVGIFTIMWRIKNLEKWTLFLVSFSVGALLGDVFIHLLPESFETGEATLVGLYALSGIIFSFVVEKFIHWRHCHLPESKGHHHEFAYMSLVGDSVHNFIDGIIIAISYLVSIPVGIATTVAVILHEIPQEIGDFGILVHGGFSKAKALFFNFLTALTAVLGAILGLFLSNVEGWFVFLIPFAAGNLIYIASSDLIPELHNHTRNCNRSAETYKQLALILLGIGVMAALLLLE